MATSRGLRASGRTSTGELTALHAYAALELAKVLERALAELDLTVRQYRTLAFVERDDLAVATLARALAVQPPTVTVLIDRLVERGLVRREAAPNDRRWVLLRLTRRGSDLLAQANVALAHSLSALATGLGADGVTAAARGLETWKVAIDARLHEWLSGV